MGLCVFLLIFGPAVALIYFPLTTRNQSFQIARAGVSQTPAGVHPARRGASTISWTTDAERQSHSRKSAA